MKILSCAKVSWIIQVLRNWRAIFQRVPTMNLPTSWPCLLPGNHQDHGCQQANEDVSEAYPPELPTYARSLSCPLAILEIPFVVRRYLKFFNK